MHLVGFHTGCLVALEMAKLSGKYGSITLVDVPYFDDVTKAKHRSQLDPNNPMHTAFFAAFDYDLEGALQTTSQEVTVIATNSSLLEPTRKAAQVLVNAVFKERKDIYKPVFEQTAIAKFLLSIIFDNSQTLQL